MALPTRIELKDDATRPIHEIIDELVNKNSANLPSKGADKAFSWKSPEQTSSGTLTTGTHAGDDAVNLR
jgi:hypothetical protein